MIVPAIRLFRSVLEDATHGVNAQLTALAAGGYLDGDPSPGVVTIGDEVSDARPATGRPMDSDLSITVFLAGASDVTDIGTPTPLDGFLVLGARIDTVGDQAELNTQGAGHILRAMYATCRWWYLGGSLTSQYQIRNHVQLVGITSVTPTMFAATAMSPRVTVGLKLTAQFRDVLPD